MNQERILEYFKSRLLAVPATGITPEDIALPNIDFERKARSLWYEITLEVLELRRSVEDEQRRQVYVNCFVCVPHGSGTARANNIAARVARMFSPSSPDRDAFVLQDGSRFWVRDISQKPPFLGDDGYKINVRFVFDVIIKEF